MDCKNRFVVELDISAEGNEIRERVEQRGRKRCEVENVTEKRWIVD